MCARLRGIIGEGEAAHFNGWGVGSGSSSGYRSSMRASAISRGEGVVVGGMSGERITEMLEWVGVGDSGVCGRFVMIHPNFSHPHRTPSSSPYPSPSNQYH